MLSILGFARVWVRLRVGQLPQCVQDARLSGEALGVAEVVHDLMRL